jgi:hypothetical protein
MASESRAIDMPHMHGRLRLAAHLREALLAFFKSYYIFTYVFYFFLIQVCSMLAEKVKNHHIFIGFPFPEKKEY